METQTLSAPADERFHSNSNPVSHKNFIQTFKLPVFLNIGCFVEMALIWEAV